MMPYADDAQAPVHINHYQFQSVEWCGRIKRCYSEQSYSYTCDACIEANYHNGRDMIDDELYIKRGGEKWLASLQLEQSWPTDNCTCEAEARAASQTPVGEHLQFEGPHAGQNVVSHRGALHIGVNRLHS